MRTSKNNVDLITLPARGVRVCTSTALFHSADGSSFLIRQTSMQHALDIGSDSNGARRLLNSAGTWWGEGFLLTLGGWWCINSRVGRDTFVFWLNGIKSVEVRFLKWSHLWVYSYWLKEVDLTQPLYWFVCSRKILYFAVGRKPVTRDTNLSPCCAATCRALQPLHWSASQSVSFSGKSRILLYSPRIRHVYRLLQVVGGGSDNPSPVLHSLL